MIEKLPPTALAMGLALVLMSLSGVKTAEARPDTRAMTCGQAAALVRQSGAIVLSTGRVTYDRFVANERHCPVYEVAERAYVPTRDAAQCFVGYRCVIDRDRDDRWWWLKRRP
ncbi:hypothetical protein [Nitratireductor thuwali]|uniref:Uncharacterized protein n=1 Tax=Nitratireductor thuwali TaxID=2267699 RepID=A0ABY5MDD8_9HYPH|nr:hypothetical protein NTH_00505 [Nitratireductor thuwali]